MKTSYSTGNVVVDAIGAIPWEGNLVPNEWYSAEELRYDTKDGERLGSANFVAIAILADIVYWYRPSPIRKEGTDLTVGYRKKFREDKLQLSYSAIAKKFGITKRQATNNCTFLEERGLIRREFRHIREKIKDHFVPLSNVLYVEPIPSKLANLTYPSHPRELDGITPESENDVTLEGEMDLTLESETYTKISPETISLENKEYVSEELTMSLKKRLQRVAVQLFGSCEPDSHPIWDKMNKKYKFSDEREIESLFYDWGGEGGTMDFPITAFYNDPSSSPRVVKERVSSKQEISVELEKLSREAAVYSLNGVAFDIKMKKLLQPVYEEFGYDTLFLAFKRYWDGIEEKKSEKFAANNFSQTAGARCAVEVFEQEKQEQALRNKAAVEEASRQRTEQIEREIEEQRKQSAEEQALIDVPVEF